MNNGVTTCKNFYLSIYYKLLYNFTIILSSHCGVYFMANPSITFVHQDKSFILDESVINDWFAHIALTQRKDAAKNSPEIANQLLSQFGIKSAVDIIKYLQSPAGKIAEAQFNAVIAEILSHQEINRFVQIQSLAKERALAFMILGLKHDKIEAHRHLMTQAEDMQNKKLLQAKKAPPVSISPLLPTNVPVLEMTLSHYEEAYSSINTQLEISTELALSLEEEWLLFEKMIELSRTINAIHNQLLDEIYALHEEETLDRAFIDQSIAELTRLNDIESNEMNQIFNPATMHDDEKMISRIQAIEGRRLQLFVLYDLQAALTLEQKLVHRHGKFYILSINQKLDNLSPETQEQAHLAYLSLRPSLERTRNLIKNNQALESRQHAEQYASLSLQSDFIKNQIRTFDNQLTAIQASIANVTQMMKDTQIQHTTPTLTLTPRPSPSMSTKPARISIYKSAAAAPKPVPYVSYIYRLDLCKLRNNPTQNAANLANKNQAILLKQQEIAATQQVKPGVPISPVLMQALMRYNNGVITQRTQILSPIQQPNKIQPQSAPEPNTTPTPFSLRPEMRPKGG